MRAIRNVLLGAFAGTVIGTLTLILLYASFFLASARANVPQALVVSTVAGSAGAGVFGVAIGCLVSSRERSIVAVLLAVAVAALFVLPGGYGNNSYVPPAMFAMAIVNGLLVSRAIRPLCAHDYRQSEQSLY